MTRFNVAMVPEVVQPFWEAQRSAASSSPRRPRVSGRIAGRGLVGSPAQQGAASSGPELEGRCLSFAEREEIALGRAAGESIRSIAARIGRSASTISRELPQR
jgi:IS30 family transposase